MFRFLKRKPIAETKKKLPASDTVECGLCNDQIEPKYLYVHWQAHTIAIRDDPNMVGHGGPLRSAAKQHSMIFIVRRPTFRASYQNRFDLEQLTAQYFATAIISLKQQWPDMRFQYVPVAMGGSGEYLRTLLVVAEWDEE